jgi:hypothetical protein
LLVGLAFRAFIYGRFYIEPGEPYGISDVIELLLSFSLICTLFVTTLLALYLGIKGPRHNRIAAGWSGLTAVAILLLVGPLHTLVARLVSA